MQDNHLSIETGSDSTGVDPVYDGLITPALRNNLEAAAPQLLDKFDSIRRDRKHQLEETGRRYNQIKADWAKEKETFLRDMSQKPERSGGVSSGSSDRSRLNDSSSASSQSDPKTQATTQARQRVALSTSTDSNPVSPRIDQQPQATTQARQRVAISTSTDSNPVSPPTNQAQATTQARQRVALSTSTDSKAVSPPFDQQPQAIAQARSRVPHSSTASTTANSDPASSTTSSARARRALTSSEAVLTMQTQIRLIPAIKLLTASITTPGTRAQANAHAHAALEHAMQNNASPPLAARCAFYIAHAIYDPKDDNTTENAVNWFQRATDAAEADYPEGQWAQEWLNRYESLNMDSRPGSSSSWISRASNSVWNAVFRRNSGPEGSDPTPAPALKLRPAPLWHLYENTRSANYNRAKNNQRIPSFTTMNSGETPSPSSAKEASPIPPSSAKDASPTTPSFGTTQDYYDYYGVKWSPGHLYGKGKIINDQEFQLVFEPDPFSPGRVRHDPEVEHPVEISEEQEQRLRVRKAYFAGQVNPSALSFRSRQLWARNKGGGPSWRDIMDYPEIYLPRAGNILRVVNGTPSSSSDELSSKSGPDSPIPTAFSWEKGASLSWEAGPGGNLSLSIFPLSDSGEDQHAPVQYVYLPYRPPPVEPAPGGPASAEGLDVQRTLDEAAQMEEGQSPGFGQTLKEAGLYMRRVRRSDSGIGDGVGDDGHRGEEEMNEEEEQGEGPWFYGVSGELTDEEKRE